MKSITRLWSVWRIGAGCSLHDIILPRPYETIISHSCQKMFGRMTLVALYFDPSFAGVSFGGPVAQPLSPVKIGMFSVQVQHGTIHFCRFCTPPSQCCPNAGLTVSQLGSGLGGGTSYNGLLRWPHQLNHQLRSRWLTIEKSILVGS